jgi:CPA2 family monovalent cation:H+ antiporter-2
MTDGYGFLETLAVVLCVAAVTTVLFQQLKQPVVLGYLLAGMVVGPYIPIPLQAEAHTVEMLAQLGVILLMFSLGLEFSLTKLLRIGTTAGFVAIVQCSLMLWLGYVIGQAFGWTQIKSFFAGAVISISSTTIIVKAFQEQGIKEPFTQVVFGILIVEDLIAILLLTILTALSSGEELSAIEFARASGHLVLFLAIVLIVGLFVVPRVIRAVVRFNREETIVVASVGLAFGFAMLAATFGYSVALGAFLGGALVAESGVERTVEDLVQPVRDIFAAIFFVSVGMLIDPAQIAAHWLAVLVFLVAVIVGKIVSVTVGAFFTGQGVQNSVKSGMSLAQIGEFSFIIAGVGLATGASDRLLYSIAVAVSAITTLFTPWLICSAPATAAWIDRKLPRSLQTFAALYASWLDKLRTTSGDSDRARIRSAIRWLVVDTLVVAAIVIGASVEMNRLVQFAQGRFELSEREAKAAIVAGAAVVSAPFAISMVRVARYLGFELAGRVFPAVALQQLDLAAAPRRLLVMMLQLAIVLAVGIPLVAITQPFLPPFRGAAVLVFLLLLLAFPFWRGATNFQGHVRAGAQALADALTRQTQIGRNSSIQNESAALETINETLAGLGSPIPLQLEPNNPNIGKTLAEIKLRGITGATVLAIQRGKQSVLIPSGHERLEAGDVLALAGTDRAVEAARELLSTDGQTSTEPTSSS